MGIATTTSVIVLKLYHGYREVLMYTDHLNLSTSLLPVDMFDTLNQEEFSHSKQNFYRLAPGH